MMAKLLLRIFLEYPNKTSFYILLLSSLNFLAAGPLYASDTLLWEVKSKTATVYIFGSIHVANETMYPLPEVVEQSFDQSEFLVVEVNQLKIDQIKLQEKLLTEGMYQDKQTLSDNISGETLQLLKSFLRKVKIPYPTVAKMRPGMVAITLTVARSAQLGFKPEFGIDLYFLKKATGKKRILQLETAEQQLDLLLDFSDQNILLQHTVVSLDELDKSIDAMVNAWKSGNVEKIESITFDERLQKNPKFKKLFKRMFEDRNVSMAKKITDYLNQENTYFVVVGAGHLVGEKSIINILKNNKFTVKRR